MLAKVGFDTTENEPSKAIFSYFVIPQILKYTNDISGSSFRGMIIHEKGTATST